MTTFRDPTAGRAGTATPRPGTLGWAGGTTGDSGIEPRSLAPYLPRLTIEWAAHDPERRVGALDGSLLFVDISGFTKMSERLARHGKVGAEEVTDAIGTCFEAVLAVAYAGGGGLLKFGGDALLLLFTGDDHARRASEAAIGMQARLGEVGRLDTTAGRVVLRMSAGVHTGTIHCFLVGESHRELLLVGPDVSTTGTMEGAASAGQIVVSSATASRLPAALVGPALGPGRRLRRVALPPPGPVVVSPAETQGADLGHYLPTAIRSHLLETGGDPQHRRATVAFCHFDGTDDLLRTEGPEAVAEALDHLVRDVQRAADDQAVTFLGTDIDHDGGKIILVAGVPRAEGGDEERMLAALRRIVDGERRLPVRIGVHSGPIFAGDVGPHYRRTYTVMGDTVNLAARVMSKAEPGQILATAAVLDRSRTQFETVALEPFSVKGKRHPVEAFVVGAASRRVERSSATLPLVGRTDEIAAIDDGLEALRSGAGRVIEIVGDAGIGKSRLADELIRRADDLPNLRITCDPYDASTPYAPFWWLLHDLLGVDPNAEPDEVARSLIRVVETVAPDLEPWLPLLASIVDVELPPTPETAALEAEFRRDRTNQVVATFLHRYLPDQVLVVFEDAQFLDEASRGIIRLIAAGISTRAALLCITRREPSEGVVDEPAPHITTLRPDALSTEEAVAALAGATEEAPLRPHELTLLAERAGGNPLFLSELLHTTLAAGGVDALPDSIDAVITAQIDALPPHQRRLLRYAAVLGRSFLLPDLAAILDPETELDTATLHELDRFLVQIGPDHLRFRHSLLRDTAYEELPFRRRRELHGRAGDALLAGLGEHPDTEAELLSMHFFHAQRYDEAWRFARVAGDRARDKYANVDATRMYERALATARRLSGLPVDEIAVVWEALGEVRERAGVYQASLAAYRSARRLRVGDPVAEAQLLLREAWIAERAGRYSQAVRLVNRGMATVTDLPGAASVRAQLGVCFAALRQAQGRSREAIAACLTAIDLATEAGDLDAEAHARYILDWAYVTAGRGDLAVHSARALEIYEQLDNLERQAAVLNNLGAFAYFAGRWDEAISLYERGREMRLRTGNSVDAATGTINVAEVLVNQGRLDEAEEPLRAALRVFRAAPDRGGIAQTALYLGRVAALDGRFVEAFEWFDTARGELVAIGAGGDVDEVDSRIAETHLLAGDVEAALELATEVLDSAAEREAVDAATLERVRGRALHTLGRLDEARHALETSLAAAREFDSPYDVALTLQAQVELAARVGDLELAEASDRECRSLFRRLGVRREPPASPGP